MKISNYVPRGGAIVVEHPKQKTTEGGIIIPEEVLLKQINGGEGMIFCEVRAVGPDTSFVKVGDKVLFQGQVIVLTFEEEDGKQKEFLQFEEYRVLGKQLDL